MKEMTSKKSLFRLPQCSDEAAVVTTNGALRKDGSGVMGAGQALEAAQLFPGVEKKLGGYIQKYGNLELLTSRKPCAHQCIYCFWKGRDELGEAQAADRG